MIQIDLPRLTFVTWVKDNHSAEELLDSIVRPEFNDAMQKLEEKINRVESVVVPFSATPIFDLSDAHPHHASFILEAMTANVTSITIKNPTAGQFWTVVFSQNTVGGWVISGWPSTVRLSGATFVATTTALAVSTLTFLYTGTVHLEVARTTNV